MLYNIEMKVGEAQWTAIIPIHIEYDRKNFIGKRRPCAHQAFCHEKRRGKFSCMKGAFAHAENLQITRKWAAARTQP